MNVLPTADGTTLSRWATASALTAFDKDRDQRVRVFAALPTS